MVEKTLLQYKLTGIPPCKSGDIVQVGTNFFKVIALEPFYYEFRNISGGVELGFDSKIYAVPDMIPSNIFIHYVTNVGIQGKFRVQIYYQAGAPRNSVGAKSSQFFDRFQAHYTEPFTFHFSVLSGDTIEVNISHSNPTPLKGAIWFYGFKLKVQKLNSQPSQAIPLEDVREFGSS